jgi:sugar transferase (PEP-CTERM system associated)
MRIKIFGHYLHLQLLLLGLFELGAALAAYACAYRLTATVEMAHLSHRAGVFGICVSVAMLAMGQYSRQQRDRLIGIALRLLMSLAVGAVGVVAIEGAFFQQRTSLRTIALACVIALVLLTLIRAVAMRWLESDGFKRRVLVLGSGSKASLLAGLRRRSDRRGFKIIGFVRQPNETSVVAAENIIDPKLPLNEYAAANDIDEIVIAMDERRNSLPLDELLPSRLAGVQITELVTFLETEVGKVYLDIVDPSWLIFSSGFRRDELRLISERAFDLCFALLLLICAAPFMLLAAIAIKLEDGPAAPLLYKQDRVGFGDRVFRILKFRSMRVDAEGDGKARWAVTGDSRVTRVGALLRKLRVDELPQLLNILAGNMSFVGPRPERPEFVEHLNEVIPYYRYRHTVKPGLTGWAQLRYPYGASDGDALEKLKFDLYYVKNHGLMFDLIILLQTAEVILFAKGSR